MIIRKCPSGILAALLVLNTSLLMLTIAVKPIHAAPDPWELPVVYIQAIPLSPNTLLVNVAVHNLTNTWYPSNWWWAEGGPLPPSVSGAPVARYYYPLGNLYAFDIVLSWNPAVLQYVSQVTTVPRSTAHRAFASRGILSGALLGETSVNPTAGTCRTLYTQRGLTDSFNAVESSANVVTLRFNVLGADDYGLSLDTVDLVLDPRFWATTANIGVQPEIPWRAVLDPALAHNVGVEAAPRNKDVIGEGRFFDTYALAKNAGTTSETFNVTIYAGDTQVGTASTVVAARTQQTVKVACNTSGLAKGTYTLRAVATSVTGEAYLADNAVIDGTILVTFAGDVNGDKCITIFDIVKIAGAYGATNQAAPNYDPYSDVDNSYAVNIFDLVMAAGNYGKCWT